MRMLLITAAAVLVTAAAANARTRTVAAAKPNVVAAAKYRTVAVYRSPTSKRPFLKLRNPNPDGAHLVFLVKQRGDGWEQVYLPTRPNGATGWVKDHAVALSLDPYRVSVSLGRHSLTVTKLGKVILRTAAGVGRSVLPTPKGTYFIAELLEQPDPSGAYGPYAFGLSAHSNVLQSFGGGPGQIGIHGTNEPGALGSDVSHGCVRISNASITRLARLLPLGTPVVIGP
jgi:lipoprotein-anchoring transpeptidase ErfK/SrfK